MLRSQDRDRRYRHLYKNLGCSSRLERKSMVQIRPHRSVFPTETLEEVSKSTAISWQNAHSSPGLCRAGVGEVVTGGKEKKAEHDDRNYLTMPSGFMVRADALVRNLTFHLNTRVGESKSAQTPACLRADIQQRYLEPLLSSFALKWLLYNDIMPSFLPLSR